MQFVKGRRWIKQSSLRSISQISTSDIPVIQVPVVRDNEFFKSRGLDLSFPASTVRRQSPGQPRQRLFRVGADLFVNRFHRRLTGASTLTRRKKGRWMRRSRMAPSQMSVVTQRSRHLLVTNSRSKSTFSNTTSGGRALPGLLVSEVCNWTWLPGSSLIWE